MKLLICILLNVFCSFAVLAEPIVLDAKLAKPDFPEVKGNGDASSSKLKKLLDDGDLKEFYLEAYKVTMINKELKTEYLTEDQVKDQLWIAYYCMAAPLVSYDTVENRNWLFDNKDIDYRAKVYSCDEISFPFFNKLNPKIVKAIDIPSLSAVYYAAMLKMFRENYDPDIDVKIRNLREKSKDNWEIRASEVWRQQFESKLIGMKSRNVTARFYIEYMDKDFVDMLVRFFPGKANVVKNYIKMAGYTDEEMYQLIDRTVGRDKQTEFLYKNRPRKYDPHK